MRTGELNVILERIAIERSPSGVSNSNRLQRILHYDDLSIPKRG
jgi:hypothetical protein